MTQESNSGRGHPVCVLHKLWKPSLASIKPFSPPALSVSICARVSLNQTPSPSALAIPKRRCIHDEWSGGVHPLKRPGESVISPVLVVWNTLTIVLENLAITSAIRRRRLASSA